MTPPQSANLTPIEAARRIEQEIDLATAASRAQDLDGVLDASARGLGLALQLGPAATEKVLSAVLRTAREVACLGDADGLSALGPVLVDLVTRVREAGALPPTAVMEAWATVALELGALIGQVGLVLAMAPDCRETVMHSVRSHAALLDKATHGLFSLEAWLDRVCVSGYPTSFDPPCSYVPET